MACPHPGLIIVSLLMALYMVCAFATVVVQIIAATQPKTEVEVAADDLEDISLTVATEKIFRVREDGLADTASSMTPFRTVERSPSVLSIPIITLKVRTTVRVDTQPSTDEHGRYSVKQLYDDT